AEAEKAALLTKAAALKEKHALEDKEELLNKQKDELRKRRETLELQTEIAATTAKINILKGAQDVNPTSMDPMNEYFEDLTVRYKTSDLDFHQVKEQESTPDTWIQSVFPKTEIPLPVQHSAHEDLREWDVTQSHSPGRRAQGLSVQAHSNGAPRAAQTQSAGPPAQSGADQDSLIAVLQRQNEISTMMRNYCLDGDILQFQSFLKSFEHVIEQNTDAAKDRLYYLEQYTRGSSATFCTERLMKQLNVSGRKTTGLKISGLDSDNFIELPEVYTQKTMPVSTENIPTKEDLTSNHERKVVDLESSALTKVEDKAGHQKKGAAKRDENVQLKLPPPVHPKKAEIQKEERKPDSESEGRSLRRFPRICWPSAKLTEIQDMKMEKNQASLLARQEKKDGNDEEIDDGNSDEDYKVEKDRKRRNRNRNRNDSETSSSSNGLPPNEGPSKHCGLPNHPELILLCDSCDSGYHTACFCPLLMTITDGAAQTAIDSAQSKEEDEEEQKKDLLGLVVKTRSQQGLSASNLWPQRSFLGGLFGPVCEIDVILNDADTRKTAELKTEDGKVEKHFLFYDGETVSGKDLGRDRILVTAFLVVCIELVNMKQ
ncbi:hypothetical protein JZ751_026029, partial [Albula glossodonta]